MVLNIVKGIAAGLSTGLTKATTTSLSSLKMPASLGLSPALRFSVNNGSLFSSAISNSLVAPSLIIGEYALAATLSLPEAYANEFHKLVGTKQGRRGKGGGMGAKLRDTGALS